MKTSHPYVIKRTVIIFLQIVIVLVGIITFAALLWEPHLEGKNVNSPLLQIYFHDPFLAYIYLASIPFFVALYQGFRGLGYARENKLFSPAAVKTLRTIKYCALLTAGSTLIADTYIRIAAQRSHDDFAGAVMVGMVIIFISIVVAAVAARLERTLRDAGDIHLKK